jgi:hypothetical protein
VLAGFETANDKFPRLCKGRGEIKIGDPLLAGVDWATGALASAAWRLCNKPILALSKMRSAFPITLADGYGDVPRSPSLGLGKLGVSSGIPQVNLKQNGIYP